MRLKRESEDLSSDECFDNTTGGSCMSNDLVHDLSARRRGFIFYKYLFILFFIPVILKTGDISGRVVDIEERTPVPYLYIYIDNKFTTITDISGSFGISSIPSGDHVISFIRIGYENKEINIFISEDENTDIEVLLKAELFQIEGVTAYSRERFPGKEVITLNDYDIERSIASDLTEILEEIPGVSVYRHGKEGYAKIVLTGPGADRVSVYLDGVKMNDPASGYCDISMIPLSSLEEIKIVSGGTAGGEPGGTVFLKTKKTSETEMRLSVRYGSFLYISNEIFFSLSHLSGKDVSLWMDIKADYYRGEYPVENYSYPILLNNNAKTYSVFGKMKFSDVFPGELSLLGSFDYRERGLPGLADGSMMTLSRMKDRNNLFSISWDYSNEDLFNTLELSYFDRESYYNCPGRQPIPETNDSAYFYPDSTIINTVSYNLNNRAGFFISRDVRIFTNFFFTRETYEGKDLLRPFLSTENIRRISINPSAGFLLSRSFRQYQMNISYDMSSLFWQDNNFYSSSVGLDIKKRESQGSISLGCSWSRTARIPNFLETNTVESVYSAGNPDLLPEKAENITIYAEGTGGFQYPWIISISFSNSIMWDRIMWRRNFKGQYQPYNLGKSSGRSAEFSASFTLPWEIRLNGNLTVQDIRNRTEGDINFDKYLVYRPNYRTSFSVEQDMGSIFWKVNYKAVGRRFTREANTDPMNLSNVALPPYQVLSASLSWSGEIFNREVGLSVKGENLMDIKYSIVEQMPVEGRNFKMEVELRW